MKKHFLWIVILLSLVFTQLNAQTVYITKTGAKYRTGDCRYLSHGKFSIELSNALNQRYEAFIVCKPTQTLTNSKQKENREESSQQTSTKNSESTQCSATTQKGACCKRMTSSANGLCWQHGR